MNLPFVYRYFCIIRTVDINSNSSLPSRHYGHREDKCEKECLYLPSQKTRSLSDLGGSSYDFISWLCILPTRSIRLPDFLYYNCHWVCFIYINTMRRLNIDPPNLGVFFLRFLHFALETILRIYCHIYLRKKIIECIWNIPCCIIS